MPLVLQACFWNHPGSVHDPNMDTRSRITNYKLDFYSGSTIQISSPISYISITKPSNQSINDCVLVNRQYAVYYLYICDGCGISAVNSHLLLVGNHLPGRRANNYPRRIQWFVPDELRHHQYCGTLACARVADCEWAYAKVYLLYRVTRHIALT
jgi:hypothetical protein